MPFFTKKNAKYKAEHLCDVQSLILVRISVSRTSVIEEFFHTEPTTQSICGEDVMIQPCLNCLVLACL